MHGACRQRRVRVPVSSWVAILSGVFAVLPAQEARTASIAWQPYTPARFARAIQEGQAVLVPFQLFQPSAEVIRSALPPLSRSHRIRGENSWNDTRRCLCRVVFAMCGA